MNYLNQLFEQARSLVMSMTPGSRVLAGLMFVAILVSSAFLVQDTGKGDMEYLFGGHVFKENELQLAETALSTAGLKNYERNGLRLMVPRAQRDEYIKALATGGATPQQLGGAIGKALSASNMLEPLSTTKARVLEAKQQEVAASLQRLPFVDIAQVIYDERREGFAAQPKSTASISILPRNNQPLTHEQKSNIMRSVAASFSGLNYEDVSIMDLSNASTLQGRTDPFSNEQQRYHQQKMAAEQKLREKAMNLLVDYGNVRIEANVELDPTLREESEALTYADKPIAIETTTTKKDSESQKVGNGGRPGAEPNATGSANQPRALAASGDQTSKTKEQQASERMIIGQTTTLSEKVGLQWKSATLSIAIPNTYYNNAWRRQWVELNPGKAIADAPAMQPSEFEKYKEDVHKKIQLSLSGLLPPPPPGQDARPQVTVTEYIDMPVEPLPEPSLVASLGGWFSQNWQSLGMFFIAGVALLAMRSFVANSNNPKNDVAFERGFDLPLDDSIDAQIAAMTSEDSNGTTNGDMQNDDDGGFSSSSRTKLNASGEEIRSELSSVIKTNPDIAATLLRSWIGGDAA